MKKIVAAAFGSVLAAALATAAFAAPGSPPKMLAPVNTFGRAMPFAPVVSFTVGDDIDLQATTYNALEVRVPQWSLGPMEVGSSTGGLRIADVKAANGIHASILDASNGGGSDRVNFLVWADAGTKRGTYPVQVTLENAKFGESGTVQFTVLVN